MAGEVCELGLNCFAKNLCRWRCHSAVSTVRTQKYSAKKAMHENGRRIEGEVGDIGRSSQEICSNKKDCEKVMGAETASSSLITGEIKI